MNADVRVYSVQRPVEDPIKNFFLEKTGKLTKVAGNTCGQIVINVLVEFEFHLVNIKVGVFF